MLMDNDQSKAYLITGAPQCPYPDHFLGPETRGSGKSQCTIETIERTLLGTAVNHGYITVDPLRFLTVSSSYFSSHLITINPRLKHLFQGLEDAGQDVDHLYIQFYNNYCHTGAGKWFTDTLNKWLAFSARMKPKGPLIFIGLPASTRASSGAQYYRPPAELTKMYQVSRVSLILSYTGTYSIKPNS